MAVVLNILPNHLDRHETMDLYRRTKARIFGTSSLSGDACLVPIDWVDRFRADAGSGRRWITFGGTRSADFFFEDGRIFRASEPIVDLSGTLFDAPVLGSCTGAAVAAVAYSAGVPYKAVESAARGFQPLPHRLQYVGEQDGVIYINDSKATNMAAVAAALQACGTAVHLIAGGLPKETDFTFIKEILAERVRRIYLTGEASEAMYQAWNEVCPCVECGALERAFHTARNTAEPGEIILLSPGCASFDQYSGFEERGELFIRLFHETVQGGGDA